MVPCGKCRRADIFDFSRIFRSSCEGAAPRAEAYATRTGLKAVHYRRGDADFESQRYIRSEEPPALRLSFPASLLFAPQQSCPLPEPERDGQAPYKGEGHLRVTGHESRNTCRCFSAMQSTKGRRLALPALWIWRFPALITQKRAASTSLAGTQRRTRRGKSRAEPDSRHQRRRDVAEGFPAQRALIGTNRFGPHPIPFDLALWIHTLNRGARHDGHSELPPAAATHPREVSPLAARNSRNRPSGRCDFCAALPGCQRETEPDSCGNP